MQKELSLTLTRTLTLLSFVSAFSVFGCGSAAATAPADEDSQENNLTGFVSTVVTSQQGTFRSVSVSDLRTCAIRTDGSTVCWGAVDRPGTPRCANCKGEPIEIGQATHVDASSLIYADAWEGARLTACVVRPTTARECPRFVGDVLPFDIVPPSIAGGFTKVVIGDGIQCGLRTSDKGISCWGRNANDPAWSSPPQGTFVDIAVSRLGACAIRESDHLLACWGWLSPGESIHPFARIVGNLGGTAVCGVRLDDSFHCAGLDGFIRQASESNIHRQISATTPFVEVGLGEVQQCGIRKDTKEILCWGQKKSHPSDPTNGLIRFSPPGRFKSLSMARWHACAIREDDHLVCWGDEKTRLGAVIAVGMFSLPN